MTLTLQISLSFSPERQIPEILTLLPPFSSTDSEDNHHSEALRQAEINEQSEKVYTEIQEKLKEMIREKRPTHEMTKAIYELQKKLPSVTGPNGEKPHFERAFGSYNASTKPESFLNLFPIFKKSQNTLSNHKSRL